MISKKTVRQIILAVIILTAVCTIALATAPKEYLIIDGTNNIINAGAINSVWANGLDKSTDETVELATDHIESADPDVIVLINPTLQNVLDFYQLASTCNAKLIIGSAIDEPGLQSELFKNGLSSEQIQFQTDQDWDPDKYENINKNYSY